ncbi:hypothetical protein B0H12DRAFT_1228962 [Mycena haematopus]|nr:hypothetical protein B0H12DRAFT_1228962 [Mycena haematopus]
MNEAPIQSESIKQFREIMALHLPTLFATEPTVAAVRKATASMTTNLFKWGSEIMNLSGNPQGHAALLWGLQAYIGLIAPWSAVRLKVLPLGITAELGFGVVAQCEFSTGEYIHELIGLFTPDYIDGHTELSTITCPHHETPHVFWGPIRMVNHDCSPNVQYVEVTGRRAMVVAALRYIHTGEELVCDYGLDFWNGPCPCKTCGLSASTAQQTPTPPSSIDPTTEEQLELDRRRAEKTEKKRERNRQRRTARLQSNSKDQNRD